MSIVIFISFSNAASPPGEPGDDMEHAVEIQPRTTYTERLDSTDIHDFYKFKVAYKESITLTMTPSRDKDFDLVLYDCKGVGISNSVNPAGQRDIVTGIVKDSSCEYWYADVFRHSGDGEYYLNLDKDTIEPVWTLMVYLNGDNNLEYFAFQDVNEMEAADPSLYVNVIVQFDIKSGGTYRLKIKGDSDPNRINSPVVDNPGEQNMGDGNTLVNFVRWAVREYPAKKYGLIIWDHGSGWHKGGGQVISPIKGVSQDESSGYDEIGVSSYGIEYNSVNVSSNGFLSFTSSATAYIPQRIPDAAAPNAVIAPFWRDLNPQADGRITYYAGSDKFVITWEGVKNYKTDSKQTFQVILYPTGEIVFQYKDVTNDVATTIGLEDQNGKKGKTAGSPRNGTAYRWVPTTKNILANVFAGQGIKKLYYSSGVLNIEFMSSPSTDIDVYVYNILGREIMHNRREADSRLSIGVGNLPKGVYLTIIKADNKLYTGKFFVVR